MEGQQEEKQAAGQKQKGPAIYIYFGILFGVALGTAWHNIGLGFILGAAAGYAYYQYKVKSDKKNNNHNEPDKE